MALHVQALFLKGAMRAFSRTRNTTRLVAALTTSLIACTTVRTQVSSIPEAVPQDDGPKRPEVELWVESDRPLSRMEGERARERAEAAMELALVDRSPPPEDYLLVLREQGIARTPARRRNQAVAVAGIVVGAAAAITLVFVLGAKGSGKGPGFGFHGHASHGAPPRIARAGAPSRVAPPSPFPPRNPPLERPLRERPHPASPAAFGGDLNLDFEGSTPPEAPTLPARPERDECWEVPICGEPTGNSCVKGGPPSRLPVEERGLFDGDLLIIDAVLVDARTKEPLCERRVSRRADPLNPKAVRSAMDELLSFLEEGSAR